MQNNMLELIDQHFDGKYDYFYLPMDLKTQCSVGFAFINFIDHSFILDFYLEFQYMKWSEKIPNCNSNKHVEIVYANMQGIDEIRKELLNKNIMKKNDNSIKPIIIDQLQPQPSQLQDVQYKYFQDTQFIESY